MNKKVKLQESVNRFRHLWEYTTNGAPNVNEDAPQQDPSMQGGDPGMMGGGPNAMGGDPGMMGGDPSMQGGDPGMMGGGDPGMMGGDPSMQGGDPNAMGGDPNAMGGGQPPQGFSPQGGEQEQLGATPETDPNEEEEEVIDVDDLTNAQEEASHKIDKLSHKFEKLMGMFDRFEEKFASNNEKMEKLQAEIEKRNPTPVEKMSLRAKNSYPFNVSPDEYWNEKEATSNYSPDDDNNGTDDPQYQITKSDIDDISDWNAIAKSLDVEDIPLKDMFDF